MMSITLDRDSYAAGDTVQATITLVLKKPVRARGLVARLVCVERHKVTEQRIMDNYDYAREKELGGFKETHLQAVTSVHENIRFEAKKDIDGEKEYAGGEYSVSFQLPQNAAPTSHEFGHDNKTFVWKLSAKLDIPFAIDENAEKEVLSKGCEAGVPLSF